MKRRLLPFPENLSNCEETAVKAMAAHSDQEAAAVSIGRTVKGLRATLNEARKRAQVHTTAELVELYRERTAA